MQILIITLLCYFSIPTWAYPDFIGYGYKTCVMCHYNSQGNGPLTDYGRALFSQEIAARNFWLADKLTDEDYAEKYTGFFPGNDLPWWIRPSIKYRGLWFQTKPGGTDSVGRWIQMQRDLNLVFSFDEASQNIIVLNYGLTALPATDYYGDGKTTDAVSREHYFRFYPMKKLLMATGLMDKVYGLRTSNHTQYSRAAIGLGQDDQVHGVHLQWNEEEWDASLHLFAGNLLRPAATRKAGGSLQFEYTLGEKTRVGASALTEKNELISSKRFALHSRWGFPNAPGSSVLVEAGLKQDEAVGSKETTGVYSLVQSLIHLVRGYNFLTVIERSQKEAKFSSTEFERWTFGFLLFPLQRTEVRLTAVQFKNFSPEVVSKDQWQLQGQVHVSY